MYRRLFKGKGFAGQGMDEFTDKGCVKFFSIVKSNNGLANTSVKEFKISLYFFKILVFTMFLIIPVHAFQQTVDFEFDHEVVCVGEEVKINNFSSESDYFEWDFGTSTIADSTSYIFKVDTFYDYSFNSREQRHQPIKIIKQGGNYFAFARFKQFFEGNKVVSKLYRYSFGTSLSNPPGRQEIANMKIGFSDVCIEQDTDGKWYAFFIGQKSVNSTNSVLYRLSFGNNIASIPAIEPVRTLPFRPVVFDFGSEFVNDEVFDMVFHEGKWKAITLLDTSLCFDPTVDDTSAFYTNIMEFESGLDSDSSEINYFYGEFANDIEYSHLYRRLCDKFFVQNGQVHHLIKKGWYSALNPSLWKSFGHIAYNNDFTVDEFNIIYDFKGQNYLDFSLLNNCGTLSAFANRRIKEDYKWVDHPHLIDFDENLQNVGWNDLNWNVGPVETIISISPPLRELNTLAFFIDVQTTENLSTMYIIVFESYISYGDKPDLKSLEPTFSINQAGIYNVSFNIDKDIGKTVCKQIIVEETPKLDHVDKQAVSECDSVDGSIKLIAAQPRPYLLYSIDGGETFQSSNTFDSVGMGTYFVALKFENSLCKSEIDYPVTISHVSAPVIDNVIPSGPADCDEYVGSIKIITSNGTNFQYSVNKGANWKTSNLFEDLPVGDYNVVVRKEDSTCAIKYMKTIELKDFPPPEITSVNTINPSDCGSDDGRIAIFATSPDTSLTKDPVIYNINGGGWGSGDFTGLTEGNYTVGLKYISDKCETFENYSLSDPSKPNIDDIEADHQYRCYSPDGYIHVLASGGMQPIQYKIDGKPWSESPDFDSLTYGNYQLLVRNRDSTCVNQFPTAIQIFNFCRDSIGQDICLDDSIFNMNVLLPPKRPAGGNWTDHQNTGALSDSLLNTALMQNGQYDFSFVAGESLIKVHLSASEIKLSGVPVPGVSFCNDTILLFDVLAPSSFDQGGVWLQLPGMDPVSPVYSGQTGDLEFRYYFSPLKACPEVFTDVELFIDDQPPVLNCDSVSNLTFSATAGLEQYTVVKNFSPVATDEDCGIHYITNNLNGKSSLKSSKFNEGTHYVTWTASDQAGNLAQCQSEIEVKIYHVPNIFTPNGDGINDLWIVNVQDKYPNAEIYVFDKWGTLVYGTKNGLAKWDGRVNSKKVPVGGYFYTIRTKSKVIYDGSLTVWY